MKGIKTDKGIVFWGFVACVWGLVFLSGVVDVVKSLFKVLRGW